MSNSIHKSIQENILENAEAIVDNDTNFNTLSHVFSAIEVPVFTATDHAAIFIEIGLMMGDSYE